MFTSISKEPAPSPVSFVRSRVRVWSCDPIMEEQLLNIHVCTPRLPWGATGIVSLVHGQGDQLRLNQEFLLSSQCDVKGSASARTRRGVGKLRVGRPGLEH